MASGWLALCAGLAIILHLPVPVALKAAGAAAWIAESLRELRRQSRGQARVRHLCIDATGRVTVTDRAGKTEELQVLAGSVVVSRYAWLRLGFGDGQHYGEPLAQASCSPDAWRRLQLVWRHAL